MTIWKFKAGYSNDFNAFTLPDNSDLKHATFIADGTSKNWPVPPKIQPGIEKKKKDQKPLGDINYIAPGSVVLNEKAYAVLKSFLSPFGQFLEMDALGETHYFYNVTNVIACIDFDSSETEDGKVMKEVFLPDATPKDAQVFKEPHKKRTEIYLSEAAKDILEKLIADAGLTGAQIMKAG